MFIGDAQVGKIYLGDVLISGGGESGIVIGEAEAATTPTALTVENIGNYRNKAGQLIAALQDMWEWDDDNLLTWGCFSLTKSGSSGIAVKDSYNNNSALYGGEWNVAANTSDSVTVIKSDTAIMIDMPGGALVFFTATDDSGNERKCYAGAKTGSTYKIYEAADGGTAAYSFKAENNAPLYTTTAFYELMPFFVEIGSGYVTANDVQIVRSCPAITDGLYSIGSEQFYFGNYVTVADK